MALKPLFDTAQPIAVPTAILPNQQIEDWFVAPTRFCATGSGKTVGARFDKRFNLSSSDKDPKHLIPENCNVLKAYADFIPDMQPNLDNSWCGAVVILVVNRLATPLTIKVEGGAAIHGDETAFPAKRTWDARHKHHQWERPSGSYTIPAGNHRYKTGGLGVLGITRRDGFRGAGAVWSVTPDPAEKNLKAPLWFTACSLFGSSDDRYMGVAVTDDIGLYDDHDDFYDKTVNTHPRSSSKCALAKGDDPMHVDANYTASAHIAMLDPAPTGMEVVEPGHPTYDYRKYRSKLNTLQAVLVIDTEGAHGKPGGGK